MMRAIAFLVLGGCAGVACKGGSSDPAPIRVPQAAASSGIESSSTATPQLTALPSSTAAASSATAPSSTFTAKGAASASSATQSWQWTFEADAVEQPPAGFSLARTGGGRMGRWVVRTERGSNILAQLDADSTNSRFPLAIVEQLELRDVRVAVRCKPVSGKVDQACGLVARYRDEHNYFVTRANALEGNVRLYTVKAGQREQIAGYDGAVATNAWHELRFELRGDRLRVFWDAVEVIDHRDTTFPNAGRIGLWTKADSVTYFDDLTLEAL